MTMHNKPIENTQASDDIKLLLATNLLASLKNRDWLLLRSILTKNVTWKLPGTSLISGEAIGVEAVIEKAKRIVSFGVNFQLHHVLYGLNDVALSLHNQAKRGTLILDEKVATVCTIKNRKITAINTFLSDVDMVNNFFTEAYSTSTVILNEIPSA